VLGNKPKVSRIRSVIYHTEDGTATNLVLRSWSYGKKFRATISEIGSSQSTRLIMNLSALNIRKLIKLVKIVSNGPNPLMTISRFIFYILLKHLSFGISCCLFLLEKGT
jgi:hypothetical protein